MIGVSQGGLVARYIAEDCDLNQAKMARILTIGTPNMGTIVIPYSGCNKLHLEKHPKSYAHNFALCNVE